MMDNLGEFHCTLAQGAVHFFSAADKTACQPLVRAVHDAPAKIACRFIQGNRVLDRLVYVGNCEHGLITMIRDIAEFAGVHAQRAARLGALFRGQSAALFDWGRALGDAEIAEGRDSSRRTRAVLAAQMDEHGLDLWVSPAALGVAPTGLHHTGDAVMNLVWTHAHMPALTLPVGSTKSRLPLGLQLCARVGDDERLLAWASGIAAGLDGAAQRGLG